MSELIDKQAAVDIAKELTITVKGYEMHNQAVMNYCAEIMQLPSAQPDIIRCKDCAYCDSDVVDVPYGITKKVWWCDRLYAGANENLIVEPDDFCSFAKRRE